MTIGGKLLFERFVFWPHSTGTIVHNSMWILRVDYSLPERFRKIGTRLN